MTKQNQARGMKKLYALGTKRTIDLSLSENPLGCSPLVAKKLKSNNFAFNDYPAPNGLRLKKALAEKLSCQKENLFVCNGSEAIINAVPKILAKPDDETIIPALSFPMFALCSELAGLTVKLAPMDEQLRIDLLAIKKLVNQKTKLIFICNPNNLTGSVISKQKLTEFIEQVPPSVLIVVDEANIEFGGESVNDLAISKPNVMVLRTFSKGFGLASLRIGFAVGNQNLITRLEEETPVFPISVLSEELTISALQDNSFISKTKEFIDEQRNLIQKELESLGFTVFSSQANNLFVKLPESLSTNTFEKAMEQTDISLVNGSSFAGFDDRFFRVSPRLEKVNQIFLETVRKVVNEEILL
jgi:histidinol-phosphate aminotransferase